MSNQEMQFADPDWKPSQQLNNKTNPQEQEEYIPQPINADYREQNQWGAAPSSPSQQEGYTGNRPYAGPAPQQMQGGNFRQRPYRRRGRGPWFWIILAFIIIAMTSGGFRSFNGPGPNHNPFDQKQMMGKPIDYTVTGLPTIVINDPNGNVTVIQGQSNNDVSIQPVNENNFSGNPNDNQPVTSQDGNTINASVPDGQQGSGDLQVMVPQGSNLQLQTDSGNITVQGLDGQMTLTTNDGSITLSNDMLSGSSTIKALNSGNIVFDGTIVSKGTDQFLTSSGSVDFTVPSTSAFHLNASTNSGSINNNPGDFPGVSVQEHGSGATANGDVGGSSQGQGTNVTIKSDSGDINLH
jgi:putative adhesin